MAPACGVVYVSNLPYEAHEASVQQAFESERVAVSSVQLLKKGSFNRCHNSGQACVMLARHSDVEHCCGVMDGKEVYGRPMIVRKAKFESDDPAYDSTTASAAAGAAAGAMTAARAVAATSGGSAVAAAQHVNKTLAKA
eukprot:GHRQ01010189.1.p2 GENE.GHRQ01010189.1~~GHRQ01010189.1.p2  ORF type:complete len:139 (+),score=48.65 GHRQ01010189.1:435-851(+)